MEINIKVCKENLEKIQKILDGINGSASRHTITSSSEILSWAEFAETYVYKLLNNKKSMVGVIYDYTSGYSVARCYKGTRIAINFKIVRKSTAWFLIYIERKELWQHAGPEVFYFTQEQDEIAVRHLRTSYVICKKRIETNE